MQTVLAIAMSSAFAYLINRRLFGWLGTWGVTAVVPIVEELLKTGLTVIVGGSIWWVHIIFGIIEGLFDIWQRPRVVPQLGYLAAWCSVIGHGAFGSATIWAWNTTGSMYWGLAAGMGLHLLWNIWAVRITQSGLGG